MTTLELASPDVSVAAAADPDAGQPRRLRAGSLRFFRTIAKSVGVQSPTAGVVIAPAVLASVSGGGTALVELVAAVAMAGDTAPTIAARLADGLIFAVPHSLVRPAGVAELLVGALLGDPAVVEDHDVVDLVQPVGLVGDE